MTIRAFRFRASANPRPATRGLQLFVFAVLLFGPSLGAWARSASDYYEDALSYARKGDDKAAVLELKNALQQDKGFLPAYVLLGNLYLKQRQGPDAESALLEARHLGADPTTTGIPLARAYMMQNKFSELLGALDPARYPTPTRAQILVYRGRAQMSLNRLDTARQTFAEAAALAPATAGPLVGEAQVALRQGDITAAEKYADKAVELEPKNADAWHAKGLVSHRRGKLEEALRYYGKAIELAPDHFDARLARAGLLLDLGRNEAARRDIELLEKTAPLDPRPAYLDAVMLAREHAPKAAHEALLRAAEIVKAMKPDFLSGDSTLVMVAALSNYGLGNFEQARKYLNTFIQMHPNAAGPRKLQGAVLLKLGQPSQAVSVMEPALAYAPDDYRLLALLGEAYMKQGENARASRLLERAERLSGGAPDIRTQLAFSQFATGKDAQAMDELSSVFREDPGQRRAGLTLAVLHLKHRQFDQAEKVVRTLLHEDPQNLTLLNLLGTAEVGRNRLADARRTFEEILGKDRTFLPARINLAKVDRLERRFDDARDRLENVLVDHPDEIEAMMEMAAVGEAAGNTGEAVRWLEKARATKADAKEPRLRLVALYLRLHKPERALRVARELGALAPDDVQVLETLARAQLAAGETELAKVTYRTMSRQAGFDAKELTRVAALQAATGALGDSLYSLRKALQGSPNYLPARIGKIDLLLRTAKLEEAATDVAALVKGHPDSAAAQRWSGEVALAQDHCPDALQSFGRAYDIEKTQVTVLRLYQAQARCNRAADGVALLEHWTAGHPRDLQAQAALAEGYMLVGRSDEAVKRYQTVLAVNPDQPLALNNLAYLLAQRGDARALDYARHAVRLRPDSATTNDTLGWILVQRGDADAALKYLRDAQIREARNPTIHYHLAVALHKLGRTAEARDELTRALDSGRSFRDIDAARSLRRELGGS